MMHCLKIYNGIWRKVSNGIKKYFIVNLYTIISKIKSYEGKINTNFHNDKIPKEGSQCICPSVILNDSVYRTGKAII